MTRLLSRLVFWALLIALMESAFLNLLRILT
jgi:hypothetical protein